MTGRTAGRCSPIANERWASSGWQNAVLGGWQVNGIWTQMSGTPIYIVQGTAGNLNAAGSGQVPDLVKSSVDVFPGNAVNRPPAGADANAYQYFDRSAYQAVSIPAGQAQRFGNSPRNSLRGPGLSNVDLGLFRSVTLPGRATMQFRFEMLNALNHPNFSNPGNNVSDAATFGFISSTTGVGERYREIVDRLRAIVRAADAYFAPAGVIWRRPPCDGGHLALHPSAIARRQNLDAIGGHVVHEQFAPLGRAEQALE